jgi:hypothetical protein
MESVRFLFDGARISHDQTPKDLDMEDGDAIDAVVEQVGGARCLATRCATPRAGRLAGRDRAAPGGCVRGASGATSRAARLGALQASGRLGCVRMGKQSFSAPSAGARRLPSSASEPARRRCMRDDDALATATRANFDVRLPTLKRGKGGACARDPTLTARLIALPWIRL